MSQTKHTISSQDVADLLPSLIFLYNPNILGHWTKLMSLISQERIILHQILHKHRAQLRRSKFFILLLQSQRKMSYLHQTMADLASLLERCPTLHKNCSARVQHDALTFLSQVKSRPSAITPLIVPVPLIQTYHQCLLENNFYHSILDTMTSARSALITCLTGIPPLTSMIRRGHLLPFCFTTYSILSRVVVLTRQVLIFSIMVFSKLPQTTTSTLVREMQTINEHQESTPAHVQSSVGAGPGLLQSGLAPQSHSHSPAFLAVCKTNPIQRALASSHRDRRRLQTSSNPPSSQVDVRVPVIFTLVYCLQNNLDLLLFETALYSKPALSNAILPASQQPQQQHDIPPNGQISIVQSILERASIPQLPTVKTLASGEDVRMASGHGASFNSNPNSRKQPGKQPGEQPPQKQDQQKQSQQRKNAKGIGDHLVIKYAMAHEHSLVLTDHTYSLAQHCLTMSLDGHLSLDDTITILTYLTEYCNVYRGTTDPTSSLSPIGHGHKPQKKSRQGKCIPSPAHFLQAISSTLSQDTQDILYTLKSFLINRSKPKTQMSSLQPSVGSSLIHLLDRQHHHGATPSLLSPMLTTCGMKLSSKQPSDPHGHTTTTTRSTKDKSTPIQSPPQPHDGLGTSEPPFLSPSYHLSVAADSTDDEDSGNSSSSVATEIPSDDDTHGETDMASLLDILGDMTDHEDSDHNSDTTESLPLSPPPASAATPLSRFRQVLGLQKPPQQPKIRRRSVTQPTKANDPLSSSVQKKATKRRKGNDSHQIDDLFQGLL